MDLIKILPEIIILSSACLLLIIETLRLKYSALYSFFTTIVGLIVAIWVLVVHFPSENNILLNGEFVSDPLASVLKIVILGISLVVFLYSRDYLKLRNMNKTEYYILALFAILGMMVLTSSASLLSLYMGLELMSLSLYAMIAFLRNSSIVLESAIKYFVLGAIASGMLLYGMSFIYGITGTLELNIIAKTLPSQNILPAFAMLFILAGILFKLGAVPFHMWIPDVYQGAPTSVTLFISTAPKIAAFAVVMRLLVEGMGNLFIEWQQILIIVSILSIALGNLTAIAQTNIKRMLAYSGIAHTGFFLLGILSGTDSGYASAMFYIIIYAITTLGGFGIIILLSRQGFEAENLSDYKGLAKRHPWYAIMFTILMFSMAGVPPMAGFYAKLSVLQAIISADMIYLAVIAVIFSIIGAYYYLRVIIYMYFMSAENEQNNLQPAIDVGAFVSGNAIAILLLGLFPATLMSLCLTIIKYL